VDARAAGRLGLRCGGVVWHRFARRILVAGNQVLAAGFTRPAAHSPLSARLRLRKRINHLQWGGVVTKQLFRLVAGDKKIIW
jgi:hypothetical protein